MALDNITAQQRASKSENILIVYYSYGGNTRTVADMIQKQIGGTIFEIEPATPYPTNDDKLVSQGEKEVQSKFKPALESKFKDLDSYDIIFAGFPIWWYTIPSPMLSFLSEYNLSGKTVIPFCTHGEYGKGRSFDTVSELCPKSKILEGLSLGGSNAENSEEVVSKWLQQIKITESHLTDGK